VDYGESNWNLDPSYESNVVPVSLTPWTGSGSSVNLVKALEDHSLPVVHLNDAITDAFVTDSHLKDGSVESKTDSSNDGTWWTTFWVDGKDETEPIFGGTTAELWDDGYSYLDVAILDYDIVQRFIAADEKNVPSSLDLAQLPSALHYTKQIDWVSSS
jgi:hypothetical protein